MRTTRRAALAWSATLVLAALTVGRAVAWPDSNDPPKDAARRESQTEYDVKAVYLARFLKYVTWPKECFEKPHSPIVVAIVGKDPFGKKLDVVVEKLVVQKRKVVVRRFERVDDFQEEDAGSFHVVFLGELHRKARAELLEGVAKEAVLVLGDEAGMASEGATMSFFLEKKKVRFEINPEAAKRQRLQIGSQLLRLAKIVK